MKTLSTLHQFGGIQSIYNNPSFSTKVKLLLSFLIVIFLTPEKLDAQRYDHKDITPLTQSNKVKKMAIDIAKIDSLKQLPIDTLHVWLDDMSSSYNVEFPNIAHYALKQCLKRKDYRSASWIHGNISFWNYTNFDLNGPDTIIYHRIKQIEYSEQIGDLFRAARGYLDLAIDYNDSNQQTKCQETLFKSLGIFKSLKEEDYIAEVQCLLASIYINTNEPIKAIDLLDLVAPVVEKNNDHFMKAETYLHYTDAYLLLKDYPNSQKFNEKVIKLCNENEFERRTLSLITAYQHKGLYFLNQGEFKQSESYYIKAWELSKNNEFVEAANKCRYEIGNVLSMQGKYNEALPHLISGVQAAEVLPNFSSSYYLKLSECYDQLGNHQNALLYSNKAFAMEQKISEDKIKSIESEALVKYESSLKDQQLLRQSQIIKQKNWIQWISIGSASLLLLLLTVLFNSFQKNKKSSQLLREKNALIEERNQQNELLLKEIHHRVKNNLEIVSSLLALQARQLDDQNAISVMTESQNRVQSMGIIHQKLYQGENLAAIEMKDYFINLGEGILDSFGKSEQVKITYLMKELELDVDTAVPIGLIVNELLTNALKYAFTNEDKPIINIRLERLSDDSLTLQVSDNGIGKLNNELSKGTGFGSQLVDLLTQQLEGVMSYANNQGSEFSFHFKPNIR